MLDSGLLSCGDWRETGGEREREREREGEGGCVCEREREVKEGRTKIKRFQMNECVSMCCVTVVFEW